MALKTAILDAPQFLVKFCRNFFVNEVVVLPIKEHLKNMPLDRI